MIDKNSCYNEIRIFAMSKDEKEFQNKTCEDVQREFFLNKLVFNHGEFLYRERGINSPENTLVLFKLDNKIIASATLKDVKKFDEPIIEYDVEYNGALYFDISSIEVFKGIEEKELIEIIPDFILSSRGQRIELEYLDEIIKLINKKIKKSYYKSLGIYDTYKKMVREDHSFTNHELKKILFHLVKNHENSRDFYTIKNGADENQYVLHSEKGLGHIQVDEFKDGDYTIKINLGGNDSIYFENDRFLSLLKVKF